MQLLNFIPKMALLKEFGKKRDLKFRVSRSRLTVHLYFDILVIWGGGSLGFHMLPELEVAETL